jgi:hypothetical protein
MQIVHLATSRDHEETACGRLVGYMTDDPQAVTCEKCIGKIDLQPA